MSAINAALTLMSAIPDKNNKHERLRRKNDRRVVMDFGDFAGLCATRMPGGSPAGMPSLNF